MPVDRIPFVRNFTIKVGFNIFLACRPCPFTHNFDVTFFFLILSSSSGELFHAMYELGVLVFQGPLSCVFSRGSTCSLLTVVRGSPPVLILYRNRDMRLIV